MSKNIVGKEYHLMFDTADAIVYKTFRVIRQRRGWLDVALVKTVLHYDDDDMPAATIDHAVDEKNLWKARKTTNSDPDEDGWYVTIKIYIDHQPCYATRWLGD